MSDVRTLTRSFFIETCCNCGVPFGLDQSHKDDLKRKGSTFYCPNGHPQHYTESEERRLKRRNKNLIASLTAQEDRADALSRSLIATRGHVTRIKNRVSKGVCPCCNRTFKDLANHMSNKHPNYTQPERSEG